MINRIIQYTALLANIRTQVNADLEKRNLHLVKGRIDTFNVVARATAVNCLIERQTLKRTLRR